MTTKSKAIKQTAKPKKTARKPSPKRQDRGQMEEAMKTIAALEVIQADLVHHENGRVKLKDGAGLLKLITGAMLAPKERQSVAGCLIVKVVHVNDRGERIEPTGEEKKLDRRIEGKHED